jgi:UDP-3-O-[3-hydroxymyristoyl] glucosamine N-acyltransferase
MNIKLSKILETDIKNIELKRDGEFNSFALTNGKLKRGNKLIVYVTSDEYISQVTENDEIKCVICTKDVYEKINKIDSLSKLGIVISDNPRTSFFLFHNYLNKHTDFYKNDIKNKIDSSAEIHNTCIIPEKNIIIGKNVILRPYVVLYENTIIEDDVIIGNSTVIGNPAFYYFDINGIKTAVDSTGGIILRKNVEIHSHVVICRGTLGGMTEVGSNTKIDSHVFIGHDVTIKENCLIPAGSTFAGVVTINENCFVGIGSKITPLVNIGKNTMVSAGLVVVKNVKENSHVSGNFAMDHEKYVKFLWRINKNKI